MSERAQIRPFEPAHLMRMQIQPSQDLPMALREHHALTRAQALGAFSLIEPDGRVLFCGGAMEAVAWDGLGGGYAQLWAYFARGKRHALPRLIRATRQFIDSLPHRRVDTAVADDPKAIRYAELLGLRLDVRLHEAGMCGEDLLLYRRTF